MMARVERLRALMAQAARLNVITPLLADAWAASVRRAAAGRGGAELGERVNRFVAFRSMRVRNARRRLPKKFRIGRIVGRLNAVEGNYPPLDPALAARLRADLAADNAALAEWLGRDLSSWGA